MTNAQHKDPRIYVEAKEILSSVLYLNSVADSLTNPDQSPPLISASVEEAVKDLTNRMVLKDKISLAKMDEEELS